MRYFYILFCGLLISGCSGPPTGTVSGKVSFQGKPIETGSVVFVSKNKMAVSGSDIDGEGSYRLNIPLPPGDYNVVVAPPELTPEQLESTVPRPRWSIPGIYESPEETPILKTVSVGPNSIDIAIEYPFNQERGTSGPRK